MRAPQAFQVITLLVISSLLTACPGPSGKGGKKSISQHPVGTGPFIFKKWNRGEKIVLAANPNYWGGKPKIEQVVMVPIKENSIRLAQLEEGKAHILDGLSPLDAQKLSQSSKDLVVMRQPGMNMGYLAMNVEKKPFDNVKVRQAVALAIPRLKIIRDNFQGYAKPAVNPVPPSFYGYDDSVKASAADIEKAKAMLKASGVKLPIQTELWHMPIPRPYMPEPLDIALSIAESLKSIGIECKLVQKKWEYYLQETKAGKHPMCLLGWTADVADPDNFLYVLLGKDNVGKTNVARYANEKVNEMLLKAQSTVSEVERAKIYRQVQKIIRQEAPMVPLTHADQLLAHHKDVKGFMLHGTGRKDFYKIEAPYKKIVFARGGDASNLDPALVDDGESVVVITSIYEPLVRYKSGSAEIEPALATKWTQSSDGLKWSFELRKGVAFHDGTPFNADAVIFNFERLINGKHPFHSKLMQNLNLYAAIKKVEKEGDHKVVFTLERPVAAFLGNLTIYTAHIASPTAIRGEKSKN